MHRFVKEQSHAGTKQALHWFFALLGRCRVMLVITRTSSYKCKEILKNIYKNAQFFLLFLNKK
jgi:hypothetical protein